MAKQITIALLLIGALLASLSGCKKKDSGTLFNESGRKGTAEAPVKDVPKDMLATQQAFINLVKVATPSVVNISTVSKKMIVRPMFEASPFFEEFFGGRMPRGPQYKRDKNLGSGFIINAEGYIVTNDHVVREAESIQVKLSTDKVYNARIVGSDQKTDLAVIKIEAKDLAALPWGDSNKLRVGEIVFAIGNPFGLNQTVTMGVIGAVGRANVGIADYEDFIQTDAAINPGNSGGALINAKGELVGINTAIVSRTGGYQGIGFAVPSSMAKQVMDSLIKYKKVVRGWLGVSIQEVTSDLAEEFGVKDLKGAIVSGVMKESPAEKAGIKQGDVLLQFNGKDIEDTGHLRNMVSQSPIGTKVKVRLFRQKKAMEVEVTIAELPKKLGEAATEQESGDNQQESNALSGLTVREITPELAKRFSIKEGDAGVIVVKIDPASKAFEAGIRPGDMVTQINQKDIATIEDYKKAVLKLKTKERILLLIRRKGEDLFLTIRPE